jgi:hypothetical protein
MAWGIRTLWAEKATRIDAGLCRIHHPISAFAHILVTPEPPEVLA